LSENINTSFQGIPKAGNFDIYGDLARQWIKLPNPSGKPNTDVLRPRWNAPDYPHVALQQDN